jgi:hypothetical protein
MYLSFLFCSFQYSFIVLYIECFHYDMSGGVCFLVLMFWHSLILLNLDGPPFLKVGEDFSFYVIEYVIYASSSYFFSFYNHDL